jgi:hypothetical protein
MFDHLTHDLLDLTSERRGAGHAFFAVNIDCCCCSCCWS